MKGLKIITVLALFLTSYPILAIPSVIKNWLFAFVAFNIFVIALALDYLLTTDNDESESFEENKSND